MFTTKEKEVLKELILTEIEEIKNLNFDSEDLDFLELKEYLLLLNLILNKLS